MTTFYRAMLCIRGTSHSPVSVCLSVYLSVCPSVRTESKCLKNWGKQELKSVKRICSEVSVNSPGNPWSQSL